MLSRVTLLERHFATYFLQCVILAFEVYPRPVLRLSQRFGVDCSHLLHGEYVEGGCCPIYGLGIVINMGGGEPVAFSWEGAIIRYMRKFRSRSKGGAVERGAVQWEWTVLLR
jgi:hypothetical protein